jgi:hypothetical protein
MTTAVIIIVIFLTLIHFYLKCSLMTSFSTLIAAVFATVVAFSYHEAMADLFISRGYGADWAMSGCYLLAFVLGSALFRALADLLVGSNIDLGKPAKTVAALVCGLMTGVVIAGNFLIALSLMPVQHKVAYSRFPSDKLIVLSNPSMPILNVDGFVTGLYSWLSRGALASDKSFSVTQADFLTKTHLNRYRINDGVQAIASRKCLTLPPKGKKPVRTWTTQDGVAFTVVRMGILSKGIADGGAMDASGQIRFTMAQLRLICKPAGEADNLRGSGIAVWPTGLYKNGAMIEKRLDDIIEEKDTLGMKDRVLWVDVAFKVPDGQVPVAFQFKQNATISLVGLTPVVSTPEVEQELNTDEKEADASAPAAPAAP